MSGHDLLNSNRILALVDPQFRNDLELEVFSSITSTNHYLLESAKTDSLEKSRVVIADRQTAGVGRRGKAWISRPGNISFSMLSHFQLPLAKMMGLSLVTGVTVAEVLKNVCDVECRLKWPNDVLLEDAKLAGILIELCRSARQMCSAVTGIGINTASGDTLAEIDQPIVSLADKMASGIERNEIIARLIESLLKNYRHYEHSGLNPFADRWAGLDCLAGKSVSIVSTDRTLEGIAAGVAKNGELLVRIDGKLRAFNSGDVSVRHR